MANSHKCSHCKRTFQDEELIKVGKKYYCKEQCYEEYYIPEVEDWNNLYNYIRDVNYLKQLPISVIVLLKKYHNEEPYKFTYFGMEKTYEFITEIEPVPDNNEDNGLLRVPLLVYYYDKASEFYGSLFKLEEKEELEKQKEINISTYKDKQIKYKKKNLDFNLIWKEDEKDEDK